MRGRTALAISLSVALSLYFPALVGGGYEDMDEDMAWKINWEKVGMILDKGNPGEPDSVTAGGGFVMYDEDMWKMWFSALDHVNIRIMYATSPDGLTWTKKGVVVDLGAPGEYDDEYAAVPSVLRNDEGTYEMWYTGQSSISWGWKILYATSNDGVNWQKHGLVYARPGAGIGHPCVLVDESGFYRMWYSEYDNVHWRIRHATSSDGIDWTDEGIAIDVGAPGDPDSKFVYEPGVLVEPDGTYVMYYSVYDGNPYNYVDIHYATSPDGTAGSWTKEGLALAHGEEGDYDSVQALRPIVTRDPDDLHRLWYIGKDKEYGRMMLAIESKEELEAKIDCHPESLNMKSKGKWITCYIELPQGYDPKDIDANTILLNGVLPPELDPKYGFVVSQESYIMDHDQNGIQERMVKFDRAEVQKLFGEQRVVLLAITGTLKDGTEFSGSDTIRGVFPPKMVCLGLDAAELSLMDHRFCRV